MSIFDPASKYRKRSPLTLDISLKTGFRREGLVSTRARARERVRFIESLDKKTDKRYACLFNEFQRA